MDREGPLTNRSSNPFKSHDILNLMSCIGNFQVGDPQLLSLAKKLYRQLSGREEKEVKFDFKNRFLFMNGMKVSQYVYELVKLDESEEEGEERSEEEEAAERLDRMSILDAISQCDAFQHTIRLTPL